MLEYILIIIAGLGAGIVTGLFGGTAVLFFGTILVIFGGYEPYYAIGLGLAVDVFASIAALYIYKKHKNVDLKHAWILIIPALIGVFLGSLFSFNLQSKYLSLLMGLGVAITSLRFFFDRDIDYHEDLRKNIWIPIIFGLVIGYVLGVFGGGGGLMMLLALTILLGYKTHKAVGTSVLIMIFIALIGAASHYYYMPFSLYEMGIGAAAGITGAIVSARIANRISEKKLNGVIGFILLTLGVGLMLKSLGVY